MEPFFCFFVFNVVSFGMKNWFMIIKAQLDQVPKEGKLAKENLGSKKMQQIKGVQDKNAI